MIKAAKSMRAFYQDLGLNDETIERAVKTVEQNVESRPERTKEKE
jgi:DNA-binding transcriptional MocR family regulator